ncbi:flagellin [Methanomicrobium antiquum]|uniref:Flagellin n=1 Tax=Methanomicrobium antiquum TaxID=487686 RepID=A0AAF0JMD7_9EURY|nr:archaellin/type IV pilin N-terminal domain-containing protein [Methanomicrobium antiquum]WFN36430.1 flagellin [Methanomicrobium antiquum]
MISDSEAFTGLEAAIVLIAFVVVASVFSFAILGAGFYATSQTEGVLHNAVSEAGAMPELLGNVYGHSGGDGINKIQFSLSQSSGGQMIDFSGMVVTWSTPDEVLIIDQNVPLYDEAGITAGCWGIIKRKSQPDYEDNFLDSGEVFTILIHLAPGHELKEGQKFTIEMVSQSTGSFMITRSAPYQFDTVNIL